MESTETTYNDAYVGWFQGFTVIMTGVKRVTAARQEAMARALWLAADMDPAVPEQVPASELRRFARVRAGRYDHIMIRRYADGTYDYVTRNSGGGGHSLETLTII